MRGDVGSMINAGIEAVGKMLNNPLKALQDAGIDLSPPSFSPPSPPVSSLAIPLGSHDQQGQEEEELSVVAPPPPPMSVAMRKGKTAKLVTPKPPYKDPFLHRFEDDSHSHRSSSSRRAAADRRAERARPQQQQQQEWDTRRPPSPSRPQAEQRLDEAASGEQQTAVERAESNPSVTSEDRNLPKGVWGFF